ncbi:hypothetical protein [Streptomyces sp. MA15]|uniref:hypothetical protein n=1 Tax=Streptomyces sp. MA15 TaxID=3055061 RepID=UPI0025B0E878|nr:hypothetical protein [Streptomyces sp. MA15]MDN3266702.1 hypothetical protein [Streptomyces sp. MA15]
MNHPHPEAEPDAEPAGAGPLREALAAAAYGVTPSRVPLAAVERRGRLIRRRRRATVLGAGCGVLLAPLAFVALQGTDGGDRVTRPAATVSASPAPTPSPSVPSPSVPAPTPRIVEPGERVTAAPGFVLWLTEEGKHWTTPDMPEGQFRSAVDGHIDRNIPGVSLQSEGTDTGVLLSGLYYGGEGTASVVEVASENGPVRGKLLELPGRPGWGVWYATAAPGDSSWDFVPEVTVRDTEGGVYAQLP